MIFSRLVTMPFLAATLFFMTLSDAALAQTVVKVSLWDKGEKSMDMPATMMPMGMAMPGAMMDMATMGITVDPVEIAAGEITFKVINESQEFYHSMAISPVGDPLMELPYLADKMMVDEVAAGPTINMKELRPHDAGSLTVTLEPGKYILYCNIAGHYVMGMWTMITVTG